MDYNDLFLYEEDKMGMSVSSGHVILTKDRQNQVGISISGGAPYCPCVYIVQIFDNTPASNSGVLQAGDELVAINGIPVKGKSKTEVARLFQMGQHEVEISFNKLHADVKQGKSLDIILKKMKHKAVESMDTSTADALGLSRAILVNDDLVRKVERLNNTSEMFYGLIAHIKALLRAIYNLSRVYKGFASAFSQIGVKEPQPCANEAFNRFAAVHREMETYSIEMIKTVKPMISDLNTFLTKVVPDTHLTMKKYLDTKFEYLSYCLKVKEMDEEEYSYAMLQEPLYRVETGNYEYRLILRCRQMSRQKFAKMRKDVLVKIDLLDNKHVQDVVRQLKRFVNAMAEFHQKCSASMVDANIFPIEMELSQHTFAYKGDQINTGESTSSEEEEEEEECVQLPEKTNESCLLGELEPPAANSSQLDDSTGLLSVSGLQLQENKPDSNLLDFLN